MMRDRPKILGVIPARLDSQRLPGKVLLKIGPKPMIHWVYERARQSPFLRTYIGGHRQRKSSGVLRKIMTFRSCKPAGIPREATGCTKSWREPMPIFM